MEQELTQAGAEALHFATSLIRYRCEIGMPPQNRLAYHNTVHTRGVTLRASKFARALDLCREDIECVEVGAAFHDTVQDWEHEYGEGGRVRRKRAVEKNENASSIEVLCWTDNYSRWPATPRQRRLLRPSIVATIPSWSDKHKTVYQKSLTSESHAVVRCVALADLGTVGMEPNTFVAEGDALFLEQEVDIASVVSDPDLVKSTDESKKAEYLERYRAWTTSQHAFAKGRKALFESEIEGLTDSQKDAVRALFAHFDTSIKLATQNVEAVQKCSFEEMVERLKAYIPH